MLSSGVVAFALQSAVAVWLIQTSPAALVIQAPASLGPQSNCSSHFCLLVQSVVRLRSSAINVEMHLYKQYRYKQFKIHIN